MLTDPTGLCTEQNMVKNHGVNTWAAWKMEFFRHLLILECFGYVQRRLGLQIF